MASAAPAGQPQAQSRSGSGLGGLAARGMKSGAAATARGVVQISTLVQHNPARSEDFLLLLGFASFGGERPLPLRRRGVPEEEKGGWDLKESLQSFYIFIFGLLIFFCEAKESWTNAIFDVQTKFFYYFHFLATQAGKAFFYFYVGSITLFLLPDNDFWKFAYVVLGGVLCLLGLIMIGLRYCACCQPDVRSSG
eukprot:CAMPEP_0206460478 /NCGR_PEP_ID=MMETSP0324_2-20121206/24773_1 /ASSEMBLY_ACC=CAM_ASM_000836 /TAXON_ID=2866 /ORGANISM="Crypthecodinium cohnii, Strain Seligo" /LENGTH=193 /DNA_ID=CAMNT_0053932183 /DNA_START=29 /DNA_END=611 /DNA_ORIENTATION=+